MVVCSIGLEEIATKTRRLKKKTFSVWMTFHEAINTTSTLLKKKKKERRKVFCTPVFVCLSFLMIMKIMTGSSVFSEIRRDCGKGWKRFKLYYFFCFWMTAHKAINTSIDSCRKKVISSSRHLNHSWVSYQTLGTCERKGKKRITLQHSSL